MKVFLVCAAISWMLLCVFWVQGLSLEVPANRISTSEIIDRLPGTSFEWRGAEGVSDKAVMIVPVELDGQEYWFQLDTGSDVTMLYGTGEAERRGWRESKQWFVGVPGVSVGGVHFDSVDVFIKEEMAGGGKTAGTLGLDLLQGKVVVLDFPRQRFCVVQHGDMPSEILERTAFVPAEVRDNKLFVLIRAGGEELKDIFFDTGASSFPLVVDLDLWQRLTGKKGYDDATSIVNISSWGKTVPMVGAEMQGALELGKVRMDRAMVYYWGDQPRFFDQWPFPAAGLMGNALFIDEVVVIDLGQPTRFGILR
jgi:hypothetical protein